MYYIMSTYTTVEYDQFPDFFNFYQMTHFSVIES
jgi:hypothetical protein